MATLNIASELAQGRVELAVEIVAEAEELESRASGMPIAPHRTLEQVGHSDVVIVPTTVANGSTWVPGSYPRVTRWLGETYRRGTIVCSACSGALLLAEAGLLDGQDITTHWHLAATFRDRFPSVRLRLEHELVASGAGGRIITSGASAAWHDLALYVDFDERLDHGDGAVLRSQVWLANHASAPSPVEAMTEQSGLAERSFKRRFRKATGYSPIAYVQQLRVQRAKRMLAGTADPIDEIAWRVGYEDASAFRRLFKRITRVTPGGYRRKMEVRIPYRTEAKEAPT